MAFRTISRRLLCSSRPIFSPSRRRFSGKSLGGEIEHPYLYGGRVIYPAGCSYKGECNWIPPHRVASITDEKLKDSGKKIGPSERAVNNYLVEVDLLGTEFDTEQELFHYYIQLLASAVGSHGDAKEKIYVVWCKEPFGFGAEIDELTSNKLKDLPDVAIVLPDYAFDFKNRNNGALLISPLRDLSNGFGDIGFHNLDNRDDEASMDDFSNYSDDEECTENYSDDFNAIGNLRDCMEESVVDLHVPTN